MKSKFNILVVSLFASLMVGCGAGDSSNDSTDYYSASSTSYYQIESQTNDGESTTYSLNIVTNTGNTVTGLPLTPTSNGYSFTGTIDGQQATGTIVISAGQMGIAINSSSGSSADFATINSNTNAIPDGTYTTVCDQNNLSACTMVINNGQITVTEFNVSGSPTTLCANQNLVQASSGALNPYLHSFSCGVQGGSSTGPWYIMPLLVNFTTGIMVSEYNASLDANDNITDEIAFPQASFSPNGNYNYVYNGNTSGLSGISTATISNNSVTNTIVGTCSGAACALIEGQYSGGVGMPGNVMTGFDYYSVNSTANYNMVGNTTMNIFVDSYVGIYY